LTSSQNNPIYLAEAEGEGLFSKFKFSAVRFFEDKVVQTLQNGGSYEFSYDQIVGCEIRPYNKWSKWGTDSANWTLTKIELSIREKNSAGRIKKLMIMNVPGDGSVTNCDLATWLHAKLESRSYRS
jgi:hypothetical protein